MRLTTGKNENYSKCKSCIGMIWASFGVRIFSDNASEWQIDAVSKYAKKLKEEEIEHSSLTPEEKKNQRRLWKEWLEEFSIESLDRLKDGKKHCYSYWNL